MVLSSTVRWSELPHNCYLGHGREGLVLHVFPDTCLKIYQPELSDVARQEFDNSHRLDEDYFLVAKGRQILEVEVDIDDALLPRRSFQKDVDLCRVPKGTIAGIHWTEVNGEVVSAGRSGCVWVVSASGNSAVAGAGRCACVCSLSALSR